MLYKLPPLYFCYIQRAFLIGEEHDQKAINFFWLYSIPAAVLCVACKCVVWSLTRIRIGVFGGDEQGGGRNGPGAARTILLFHIISARPSKQPRMVRAFLKVHTRLRLAYPLRCRGY
jgi:hypothetical protein